MDLNGLSASQYFLKRRHESIQDVARLGNLSEAPSLSMKKQFYKSSINYYNIFM